jgi:MFS family permease
MKNSRYRWVIVASGGLLGCVAIGGMFSLPVFLQPIARDTGWSVTGVSSAMTIGFLAMAFTSMIWGTLSDRLGPLPVVLTSGDPAQEEMSLSQALRSPQFIILLATNFFCCATHSGPIIHTVSYAVSCGIPLIAAVSIYSVEGFAGMGGRIAFGLLGDRFGAKRVLVLGLLAQAFGALAYLFVRELAAFYAVAALFGFIYAGTMPLYAVLARENFPLRMMGTVIGGTAMAGSLGMATGPLAGGLIYDAFASYAWLYIGSWAVGLGAFLIALTFRPFAKVRAEPAPVPA